MERTIWSLADRLRLRRTQRRLCILVRYYSMMSYETRSAISIDKECLTQLEAMALPDRDVYLHAVPPIHFMLTTT